MDGAPVAEALLYGVERSMPGEEFVSERAERGNEVGGGRAPLAEEVLALHRKPVLEYAELCTGPLPGAAELLAGQAFRNTYGDMASHAGADSAWRPRLLAAVLDAAREWSTDDRRSSLHPDLRDTETRATRRAAYDPYATDRGGTGHRGLLLYAFRNLPDRTQALLWHTEVEAEDIEAVASRLGADPSLLNPERARTLLRDKCVQAHLDLAPDEHCRRHNRLIDIHARPDTGETMREVLEHLHGCAYCGAAADQLDQSPDRLPALLAEAVLGFRAADYLATRPARLSITPARTRPAPVPDPADAEAQPSAVGDPTPRPRRRGPLLIAMGVMLCGVIAATPMALSGVEDDREGAGGPAPGPTTESPADSVPGSSAADRTPPTASTPPSASAAPGTSDALVTRLRNTRTGLCLDVAVREQVVGALAVTAECAESATQVWLLEDDGRMRNQAAPGLCLNAQPAGSLALRPCAAQDDSADEEPGDTRYTLAADGLLTLAPDPDLAVTPVHRTSGAVILLKPVPQDRVRRSQRWLTDDTSADTPLPSQTARDTTAAG